MRTADTDYDVELQSVTKTFGDVVAVNDVSLRVRKGVFLSLLGPSGCGKTTLLRVIGGFEEPTQGSVRIRGRSMLGVPPNRRDTSMVFQDYALFPHMSVYANIAFGLRMRRVPRQEIREQVGEVLSMVGLECYGDRMTSQLSGGQRQRVALARSLVINPSILLLDEPLGALDAQIRKQMQTELVALHERLGRTFIYVTHDQEEALTMSSQVGIMHGGVLVQSGTPADIYQAPATPFVARFLGECNLLPAIIQAKHDDTAHVEISGIGVCEGRLAPGYEATVGDEAYLGVRPEHISIEPVEESAIDVTNQESSSEEWAIEARVVQKTFAGAVSRCLVRIGEMELQVQLQGALVERLSIDEKVVVSWPSRNSVVLPAMADHL